MPPDLEVHACSRRCSQSERVIAHGEAYYSVLEVQGAEVVRRDFCEEAWKGPPEGCLGWWRSRVPEKEDAAATLAPKDVLLNLFAALAGVADEADLRYVLGLLLVRKKLLQLTGSLRDDAGGEMLVLSDAQQKRHELRVARPTDERIEAIQQRLTELVYNDASPDPVRPNPEQRKAA